LYTFGKFFSVSGTLHKAVYIFNYYTLKVMLIF